MNTPTPTEAHTDLVESVVYSNARSAALQIAESEARAIAAAVTTLTCTHHNDQQRAACPVCLVAALTAERDQIRSDCENETKWAAHYLAQSIAEKARAERAEASLHAATEECTDVRLKWHTVMGTCAAKEDAIIELDEELATEREKSERYRLASLKLDADLAAERARLDYLLKWDVPFNSREDIDRDMQEAAK